MGVIVILQQLGLIINFQKKEEAAPLLDLKESAEVVHKIWMHSFRDISGLSFWKENLRKKIKVCIILPPTFISIQSKY